MYSVDVVAERGMNIIFKLQVCDYLHHREVEEADLVMLLKANVCKPLLQVIKHLDRVNVIVYPSYYKHIMVSGPG